MTRRISVVLLFVILAVLALALAGLASGRAGSPDRFASPSMSGDFASTQYASTRLHRSPSIYVPSDNWRLRVWPRAPHAHGAEAHSACFA